MNDESGGYRPRPPRPWPTGVLLTVACAASLVAVGVTLLAACSGGSPAASSSASSAYAKALAYAQCIRAHGIPGFPDPNSSGQFVIPNGGSNPAANVSDATRNAALKACQSLQPPSMAQGPPTGSVGASATSQGLKFAECMRGHGEPDFPDPASNGSLTLPPGMNAESPQFQNAEKACQSLMPKNPSGGSAP